MGRPPNLVICSLPAADGGGTVIVPRDYCLNELAGVEKGEPQRDELENWQNNAISVLDEVLGRDDLSEERRTKYLEVKRKLSQVEG